VFELFFSPLSYHGKFMRWSILGFSFAPLIGTYFYNQGYKISFLVCPVRHWTGIPCPTCGMTRSFIAIAKGDLTEAVTQHLFGPILFAVFLLATVHIALELLTKHRITVFYCRLLKLRKLQLLGLFVVLSYHVLRLYDSSQTGELYVNFINSPLGQLLP
jgi:hypothetical protein